MKWNNTPPPKDRLIMRWHIIWKCAIPVFWSSRVLINDSPCPWIAGTMNCTWPEDSFLPEWAECPQMPITKSDSEFLDKDIRNQ